MSDCLLGLLFSFSLLLAGVSGADVKVMVGDSVPLSINPGEILGNERLQWNFKDKYIAFINLFDKHTPPVYVGEGFTNRLNLDRTTGSLTIHKIRTEETGEYQVKIKGRQDRDFKPLKTFNVTVTDQEITVSAMKGNNFTLSTGVTIEPDKVKWKINGTDLTGTGFENMNVIQQTGDLNIINIRPEQFGEYTVFRDDILRRTFRVSVRAYEVESKSGEEGKTVTLDTNTTLQADDVIEWMFKNTLIAKVSRIYSDYILNERLRDKLDVDWLGSLIIKDLKNDDSGLYILNITNSKRYVYKTFNVTVTGSSPRSHQVKIGPGLFLVLIMLVISVV